MLCDNNDTENGKIINISYRSTSPPPQTEEKKREKEKEKED